MTMLTKEDIKKLLEVFATKEDLIELIDKVATKGQFNQFMEKLDAVYGEVKDMRQEQSFHAGRHAEITDDIEAIKLKLRN